MARYHAVGFTGVTVGSAGPEEVQMLQRMKRSGLLKMRMFLNILVNFPITGRSLKSDTSERTLQAKHALHRLGTWYHAALVYDGVQLRHYVNRQLEASGPVYFPPLEGGQTSIGCRLNRLFWFKGAIRTVRVTPAVLDPKDFLPMPEENS